MSSEAELEGLRERALEAFGAKQRWAEANKEHTSRYMSVEAQLEWSQAMAALEVFMDRYEDVATPELILSLLDSLQSTRAALERAEAVVEAAKAFRDSHWSVSKPTNTYVDTEIKRQERFVARGELFTALKNFERTASREDA